jgi:para-nitrobenzyl esterase
MNVELSHTIKIASGRLTGAKDDGLSIFKGIPYAAPPIGDLRWRPPQPPLAWDGVRECTNFGPAAPQIVPEAMSMFGAKPDTPQSEDCLSLNIWTPDVDPGAKLPVMVWIHGGGFRTGMNRHPMYTGAELAKRGVVVVNINYRLNLFGMFAHPLLSQESGQNASGNYSMMDILAAFKWVRENITAFGGDETNVTAFGESAGSRALSCLLASPLSDGLFDRAICESGAVADVSFSRADRETAGLDVMARLGGTDLESMRNIPTEAFVPEMDTFPSNPIIDGHVMREDPIDVYRDGRQLKVPVILGVNGDEATLFTKGFSGAVEVPAEYGDDPDIAAAKMARKRFVDPVHEQARWHQATGADTYLYQFTRVPPYRAGEILGSFHGSEISYVFGGGIRCGMFEPQSPRITDIDRAISDAMMSAWVNFAENSSPNRDGHINWPKYDPDVDCFMEFGDEIDVRHRFPARG